MCAINGFTYKDPSLLKKMMNICQNRGPDWREEYYDPEISLGHNRLSILDTSKKGHQPMYSQCKRYLISFNGEIYNFIKLRDELISKGYKFNSNSDTEVLLNGFIEFKQKILKKLMVFLLL